tara:strand:+ start:1468 stop:2067 length:600 start_codon:yes stop_codon:yes gene_type:complete
MSNLLQDGYNIIDGYRLQQDEKCSEYFERYLSIINPERILELGTANGGLTNILRKLIDCPILTVEQNKEIIDPRTYNNAEVVIGDFFSTTFIDHTLIPFISLPGRTLVLCDAFNKIHQYRKFVRFIKPNDVIAVHDYFPTIKYFNENIKGKRWNWCDITDQDIQAVNQEFGMVDIGSEINYIFWASKIKKGSQKLVSLV